MPQERRDLALTVGAFGRAASQYNLLSRREIFGLSLDAAKHELATMLQAVKGWIKFFDEKGVEHGSVEIPEQAILLPLRSTRKNRIKPSAEVIQPSSCKRKPLAR